MVDTSLVTVALEALVVIVASAAGRSVLRLQPRGCCKRKTKAVGALGHTYTYTHMCHPSNTN